MKLYAISDLHLHYETNRQALTRIPAHPDDWLILAGDIGETAEQLEYAVRVLSERFQQLLWVPGNHELWTLPTDPAGLRGEAKYRYLVALCRRYHVLTPEDPYALWPGEGPRCVLAPLFLLYDYSFRSDAVPHHQAVQWAMESGVLCTDEIVLHPDPYPSCSAWCVARCQMTAARLATVSPEYPLVLINHFPLRQDLIRLPTIPRFSIWCGTRQTEDWHRRFRVAVVVSGHLHRRATDWRDGVRFEEVSLGYPRQWQLERGIKGYLRQILPGPSHPAPGVIGHEWHR